VVKSPTTICPNTTLAIVVDRHIAKDSWKQLVKKFKALQNNALDLRIFSLDRCQSSLI
jgi:hypothetical protein